MSTILKIQILFCFLFVGMGSMHAQKILENRIIIKTSNFAELRKDFTSQFRESAASIELLSEDLGYALLIGRNNFDQAQLKEIRKRKNVLQAFYDRGLEERIQPDDPSYGMQGYLNLINAPKIWELTTGGKTSDGSDVVIAILDSGVEIAHPDLVDNIFVNQVEIPGDFIDNDANGYIDDVSGLNASRNNGTHEIANHGTWVCGIAGAKGNNGLGVTGINWNIKILPVTGVTNVSTVLKGYDYILKMKKLYLQTNGKRGANVLVTNYSGGLDNAFGNEPEYKPWCDMYNLLGAQGILSFGSTTNSETNIDVQGDMPSTCDSEFFIGVTSTDDLGVFSRNSGFGTSNIDLAAPGENIFNLRTDGKYYDNSGTSASSPLAAGVAALLFSAPCPKFGALIKSDKIAAARAVRDAIFNGVKKTDNLKSYVKYGGYLDAYGALLNMQEVCEGQLPIPSQSGNLAIERISIEGNDISVRYITPKPGSYTMAIYDAAGKLIRSTQFEVAAFGDNTFRLTNEGFVQGVYYFNLLSDTGNAARATFLW